MPTPDRTSLAHIVAAGRGILEESGQRALTMQAVALRVGVKAPSLYKRVRNRDHLVGLVVESILSELGDRMDEAAGGGVLAGDAIRSVARELREFAHEQPAGYGLVFGVLPDESRPGGESLGRSVAALVRVATDLVGERDGLKAARTLTAWATGFIGMELAGAFRLGGDVDEAYDYGVEALVRAFGA